MVRYEYTPDVTGMAKKTNTDAIANPWGKPMEYKGPETIAERTKTDYPDDWLKEKLEALDKEGLL